MAEQRTNPAALTESHASKAEDAVVLSGAVGESIHRAVVNGQEAWVRVSTEPHLRSVEAAKNESGGGWSVSVAAMKIVRPEHAACRELREAIEDAIKAVPGVTEVEREVNEAWWASGYPSGEDLARAVAHVLDQHADRLRDHYNSIEPGAALA
jgi:hypothetical protein